MSRRSWPPRAKSAFNVTALERELHRTQPSRRDESIEIIKRYARLKSNGEPMRCTPSRAARESDDPLELHSTWKVIFDDADAARACAHELRVLYSDTRTMYVYPCGRSRRGHVHLTKQRRTDNLPEPGDDSRD